MTTAARLLWSSRTDPVVEQPLQMLLKWKALLNRDPVLRALLGKAWCNKPLQKLSKKTGNRWTMVAGPATAVLANCFDQGWQMTEVPG